MHDETFRSQGKDLGYVLNTHLQDLEIFHIEYFVRTRANFESLVENDATVNATHFDQASMKQVLPEAPVGEISGERSRSRKLGLSSLSLERISQINDWIGSLTYLRKKLSNDALVSCLSGTWTEHELSRRCPQKSRRHCLAV